MPIAAMEADEGPYRLRRDQDAVWPPKDRAYGGELESLRLRLERPVRITTRLMLPVMLFVTLLGAAYLYTDAVLTLSGAPVFVQNALLTISDLILPMAWMVLHLTNRRYGAPYAFGQLLAGVGIVALVALANPGDIANWIDSPLLGMRSVLAFGMAFVLANAVGATFFDAARGPRWWTAPLWASFATALLFSLIYYPAAFAGNGQTFWLDSALVHFAVFFGESVLLLLPYHLLRPAMRPLHGMNGY
jgi:uncharacterized PurR-regulated membrane protein YhhQ (DUF165 family)